MKSTVLLTAMLSGLCAEAVAAPIGIENRTAPPVMETDYRLPRIERDLDFSFLSVPSALFTDDNPRELITTDLSFNAAPAGDFTPDLLSAPFRVPEPLPVTTMAIGLSCLGILAFCRKARGIRRADRRRRVGTPALTVLQ